MLDSGAGALHVHTIGEGPPVLYLHGFPEYFAVWRPLLARLRVPHRAIMVDLPGFNRSLAARGAEAAAPEVARRVVRALDTLGIDRFAIVAHDLGGLFAWQLASDCRGRVAGLFLLSAPHPADFIRHFWKDRPATRSSYLDELAASRFDFDPIRLAGLVFPDGHGERGPLEAALRQSDAEGIAALYRENIAAAQFDRWSRLPPIACRVQAIGGQADRFVPPATFAALPSHVAAPSDVVILDRAGHFLQITQTVTVAARLDDWLAAVTTFERRPDDVL